MSQQTIVLNTAYSEPISNDAQTGFADQVVAEAFRRIGYQLKTVHLPAERALINANLGIDDGDLLRVAGLQEKYPNLIQVPEVILSVEMVLFSKIDSSFILKSWETALSHSVAIISGWKIMEKNFGKLGSRVEIIKTDNIVQSFTLLEKNRVDMIAYSKWSGLEYIKANNITDIKLLRSPLASPNSYVYLHKKHKKIVPKLAAALKQMKIDGTIKKIFNRILRPLMQ